MPKTELQKMLRNDTIRGRKFCDAYKTSYCARLCDKFRACPVPGMPHWAMTEAELKAVLSDPKNYLTLNQYRRGGAL